MGQQTSNTSKRGVVLQLDDSKAWAPQDFADMFISHLTRGRGDAAIEWSTLRVAAGETLDPALVVHEFDAFVLTGSRFNCRDADSLPWFVDLVKLVRLVAADPRKRLYGGCFGCQVIAVALGGRVDYNPSSTDRRRFLLLAESINIMKGSTIADYLAKEDLEGDALEPLSWKVIVSHGDCVLELPKDADRLASSKSCENEVFVAGLHRNLLAVQSHPEFDYEYAIKDRIWKAVVEKNQRLSEEEQRESFESFAAFGGRADGPDKLMDVILKFLTFKNSSKVALRAMGFCGADDSVHPEHLLLLSQSYPWIEWGVLFRPDLEGTPRYATSDWVRKLSALKRSSGGQVLRLAGHLCGERCQQVLDGEAAFVRELRVLGFARVQINATAANQVRVDPTKLDVYAANLRSLVEAIPTVEFIFQLNEETKGIWEGIVRSGALPGNVSVLFDASCGLGVETSVYQAPLTIGEADVPSGYAGGIGPRNISSVLRSVEAAARGKPVWIDMESSLRTFVSESGKRGQPASRDVFSIDKCLECALAGRHLFE